MKQCQQILNLLQIILIFFFFCKCCCHKLKENIVKVFSHCLGQITDEIIFLSPTTPADVEFLLNCIKPNKAIGPNSIPTKILKEFQTHYVI